MSGSLSSVVSDVVRASMESRGSGAITEEDLDRHIGELILREAKRKAEQYAIHGIRAYLPKIAESNAPRANKRFLSSVIRNMDDHNKAVLQAQARAAQEIKRERAELERKERWARAKEAAGAWGWKDSGNWSDDKSCDRSHGDRRWWWSSDEESEDESKHEQKRRRGRSPRLDDEHRSHRKEKTFESKRRRHRGHHCKSRSTERTRSNIEEGSWDDKSHRRRRRRRSRRSADEHNDCRQEKGSEPRRRRHRNRSHSTERTYSDVNEESLDESRHKRKRRRGSRSPSSDDERHPYRKEKTTDSRRRGHRDRPHSREKARSDMKRRSKLSRTYDSPPSHLRQQDDSRYGYHPESKRHRHSSQERRRKHRDPKCSSSRKYHPSCRHRSLSVHSGSQVNEDNYGHTPTESRPVFSSSPQSPGPDLAVADRESELRRKLKAKLKPEASQATAADPTSRPSDLSNSAPSHPRSPSATPPPLPLPPSKMDKYFEESYDPRFDTAPLEIPKVPATGLIDNASYEGWDAMLELLRLRREDKEERKRMERLGLTKDKGKKLVSGSQGAADRWNEGSSIMDLEYKKKGSVREWDLGKQGL